MRWSDIPWRPPPRMLRQFAGLWIVFFGGLALWLGFVRQQPTAAFVVGALAVGVGLLGLVRPAAVRPIFVAWMALAFPIGWVVSRLMLGLVYYGLFTPLALIFRLIGRDELRLKRPAGQESHWQPKTIPADPARRFRPY